MIHLATGIAISEGRLLMVASRYPSHPQPLWNLPGGRQLLGELLAETVVREFYEETGLRVEAGQVAYVSESYDGDVHVLNVTFSVEFTSLRPSTALPAVAPLRMTQVEDDHVVEAAWVPLAEVGERIAVGVVREPLLAYLRGELTQRYAGFHEAGVTIEWPEDSR
ncbi:MAG TPA: NUDIX domain-containing protein [Candidatus Babeliales bacterium]|nr:NUDIX domain-containing protein [Candidatus Babeliales bacterium]